MSVSGYLDKLEVTVLAEDSVLYESPLWGQHGVSFLLEAYKDGVKRNVLVDVAQSPEALLHNMKLLGVNPSIIDAVILTHCHYDHTQGLAEILKAVGKRDLPIIAHPDIFRLNFVVEPYLRHVGVMSGDSRERIEESGGTLYLTRDPLQIMPGLVTTGRLRGRRISRRLGYLLRP
jgi:7,8-dihydropterin-6-yl-methyl-4-(beta-D-ribofuranosyl)aminobenzene 5'-phosphate synthase